jgi:pyruvate,water dikinase
MTDQRSETAVLWLDDVDRGDLGLVGGKNASLGEMIQNLRAAGVRVPGGFAVTAQAYRDFIAHNDLDGPMSDELARLDEVDVSQVGPKIRQMIEAGEMPGHVETAIREAYTTHREREGDSVAVRSSATAEDLPDASFAGQQETFLNVRGADEVVDAVRRCFASLYTDRAIIYREVHGFEHQQVAISVAVQTMIRSDLGAAGVAFTIDTETGFEDVILIDGAWGLGENVVKGTITPDEYRVFKPLLDDENVRPILDRRVGPKKHKMVFAEGGRGTRNVETTEAERQALVLDDDQLLLLARWCKKIEDHYGRAMDIEWAVDGEKDELWIVQARSETVQSQKGHVPVQFTLKERGELLSEGVAVGARIGAGKTFVLDSMKQASRFEDGGVLVASMTDPDWVPLMKRASAIVTDYGGRTSHAAIVSRELGIAAVVGTGDATKVIPDGDEVTVVCSEGEMGHVYQGRLDYEEQELDLSDVPEIDTPILLNVADPDAAMRFWRLPTKGIGLARLEFVIEHQIQVHPMALVHFDDIEDDETRSTIEKITHGWDDKTQYFVDRLASAVAKIAASQWPNPVVVRTSDFKTNEYADLVGGHAWEPREDNPMIGFRGASRYYSDRYREGFGLECEALRKVRDEIGLTNVVVMIPFCRTLEEADRVLDVMADFGLKRGENGLKIYVMAEIPSNVILAREFAERFDAFSIGSNDLTQLVLGIDRDNGFLADIFDERDPAVKRAIEDLVRVAHESDTPVGICGQAPSDHPDFAEFLVDIGIDSMSLNPDSVIDVVRRIAEHDVNEE